MGRLYGGGHRAQHVGGCRAATRDRWFRLVEEVEQGYSSTIWEYQNDLDGRQILQELMNILPVPLGPKLSRILQPWDNRFREATQVTDKRLCTPSVEELSWWCYRVPKLRSAESDSVLWPGALP